MTPLELMTWCDGFEVGIAVGSIIGVIAGTTLAYTFCCVRTYPKRKHK